MQPSAHACALSTVVPFYLMLSPLVVRTTLDEDLKPLPAREVTVAVRCYEARLGRSGIIRSNILFEQSVLLWSKQPDVEYENLADAEWPFRIVFANKD